MKQELWKGVTFALYMLMMASLRGAVLDAAAGHHVLNVIAYLVVAVFIFFAARAAWRRAIG